MKKEPPKVYQKELTEDKCEVMQLRDIFFLQNCKITLQKCTVKWNCTVDVRPCCKNR